MLWEEAKRSTVNVILYNEEMIPKFGSGFVIKRSGDASVIITCKHCVQRGQPNDSLRIRYVVKDDVRELPAAILFVSRTDADVALITVNGLSALPPLRFSERKMLVGEKTLTIGNCSPEFMWEEEDDNALPKFHASCLGHIKEFGPGIVIMKGVAVNGMSGGPTLTKKGVSAMLTLGKPGTIVSITTEGIKRVLRMFLADRNIQFQEDSSIHHLLHIMPLR